jgi:hypothetical protein
MQCMEMNTDFKYFSLISTYSYVYEKLIVERQHSFKRTALSLFLYYKLFHAHNISCKTYE